MAAPTQVLVSISGVLPCYSSYLCWLCRSKIHICMVVHASVGIGYVVPTEQTRSGSGFNTKNCTVQGLGGIIGLRHLLLSV